MLPKYLFSTILFLSFSSFVFAQKNSSPLAGQDSMLLENERVFDIKDSDKPMVAFPIREIQTPDVTEIKYSSKDFYFDSSPKLPDVQPMAYNPNDDSLKKNDDDKLRHNYIKAGLGKYLTPYAELYLTNGLKSNMNWSINAKHASSHADKIGLRQFREEVLVAQLGKVRQNNQWNLTLKGGNNSYALYAHTDSIRKPSQTLKDSLHRGFTTVDAAFRIGNTLFAKGAGWMYDIKIGSKNIWDSKIYGRMPNNNEYNILLLPQIQYYFTKLWSTGITTDFATSFGKISDANNLRIFVNALPFAQFEKGNFKARAGASINNFWNKKENISKNNFFVAPVVEAQYQVMPGILTVYAGYKGGMKNNTYYDMLTTCRYVNNAVDFQATTDKMNIYVGTQGNLMSKFNFDVKGYYKKIAHPLLFAGTAEGRFINVVYDSLTQNWGTHIEAGYSVIQTLQIGGAIDYNHYKTSTAKAYFGAAPFQTRLFARIQLLKNKLSLQPELYLYGKTPMGTNANNSILYRRFMPDFSTKIDYRITDRFSVFLHGNNLFAAKYFPYLNYPERRFNFLGGLGFIF